MAAIMLAGAIAQDLERLTLVHPRAADRRQSAVENMDQGIFDQPMYMGFLGRAHRIDPLDPGCRVDDVGRLVIGLFRAQQIIAFFMRKSASK